MTPRPKQIVIDKDAFIGIKLESLREFAGNHLLLICDTLLYECGTDGHRGPSVALQRCRNLFDAGGYYCHCSLDYVQWEAAQGVPYPWFLPDLQATEQIRTGEIDVADNLSTGLAGQVLASRRRKADELLLRSSEWIEDRIKCDEVKMTRAVRRLPPSGKHERLCEALRWIDVSDSHDIALRLLPQDWPMNPAGLSLSDQWVTWQFVRLIKVLVSEYVYLGVTGSLPARERAEHDLQDIEYVLLLSRADAIVTRDKKLVEPLARAAFPEKEVFSSLEEVPESYRCDWAE